jgi:ribA/ribD-fused uncharacterized protein
MQPAIRLPERIATFKSPYHFLSNFWVCPAGIIWENDIFPTVEHAYQWTKMSDPAGRAAIMTQENPGDAKNAAKQYPTREDWPFIKLDVMHELLRLKFQDRYLGDWLLATGSAELVEGNTWGDVFWGVCNGVGENQLGKLLMQVRTELRIAKICPRNRRIR